MTLLWHILQLAMWIYCGSAIAGALTYVVGRVGKLIPAPAKGVVAPPAAGTEALGEPRQDILIGAVLGAVLVLVWQGGSIDLPWAMSAAAAVWALSMAMPPRVRWTRLERWMALAAALLIAGGFMWALTVKTVIDGMLLLFLALGALVLWMRMTCRLPDAVTPWEILRDGQRELQVKGQTVEADVHGEAAAIAEARGDTGERLSVQTLEAIRLAWDARARSGQGAQLFMPMRRPQAASAAASKPKHLMVHRPPAIILEEVRTSVVGQEAATEAWMRILREEAAFFSPNSTKPLSVLHLGPVSTGKEAFARAMARQLGAQGQVVAGDQLGSQLAAPVDCLIVNQADTIPAGLQAALGDVLLGRNVRWNQTLMIFISDALAPDHDMDAQKIRESLIGVGYDSAFILGIGHLVPFVTLEPWALAGVAAKELSEVASQHGLQVAHVDPEVLVDLVEAIPASMREKGASGVKFGINDLMQRKLDHAKGNGWTHIRVTKTPDGIAVLQEI